MSVKKKVVRILKSNPVAKALAETQYRAQVKVSKKRYQRQQAKETLRKMLSDAKESGSVRRLDIAG